MAAPTYPPAEITRLTGFTTRTLRYYVELNLIPGPKSHGPGVRYTREHLVRLLAIKHLRDTGKLRLDAIKRRLAKLSLAEMEALTSPAPADPEPTPPPPDAPAPAALPALSIAYARWDYIELIPGLELRVRGDAGPVLRRLAHEIHAHYGAAARAAEAPVEGTGAPG
jgi:DNA-binding transcriptional MerR regulator